MLAALGLRDAPAARRGVRWLLDQQEADGSWFGRWGVNHVYGTGAAVPALIAAGVDPLASRASARAVRWLLAHQNEDGGWGEDPRSYDEAEWIGRGPSTASQTAWALLALHAAGERSEAVERGVALARRARSAPTAAGTSRSTPAPASRPTTTSTTTSTGSTFPIMALGRCRGERGG